MTTVSGVLRDAKGMALPGVAVTLRYVPEVVGYAGGAVAQNNLTYLTNGAGLLTMPGLVAGPYLLSIAMPIGTSAAVTAAVTASLIVNGEATQSLEDALQTTIGEVTPTILSLAIAAADRAEEAADRAEVAASVLGVEECTFHPRDYIPAAQMAHILRGDIEAQDETVVTAGLQAMHDAGMAWARAGTGRTVVFRYSGTYAVNDEVFSEDFAENLWTIGYNVGQFVFSGEGAVFQVKGWVSLAGVRTSGMWAGVLDKVPKVVFRWEQKTGYPVGPVLHDITIGGTAASAAPEDDPIGLKIVRANKLHTDGVTVYNIRNIGYMSEGVVNSRGVRPTVEGCGFQPTNAGGTGFLPEDAKFTVVGSQVTASAPSFVPEGRGTFLLHGAGVNGHVHRSFYTYVDSTHITLDAPAEIDVSNTTASYGVLTGSIAAGSSTLTLQAPPTIDFVGRYIAVLFAGSSSTPNLDHLVTRVIGQSGGTLALASPARFAVSSAPIVVSPSEFVGRTTDDYPRNGGRASSSANDIQVYGLRNENPSYKGRSSAVNLFINDAFNVSFIGGKLHGQSPLDNNFGSNFAIYIADNCEGLIFDGVQLKWGKYSGGFGSQIVSGQNTSIVLRDVQIGNNFAADNARHFYIAPRSNSVNWNVMLSGLDQSGNGWPNTNQGLARYGTYGSIANFAAIGPFILDGVAVGENSDEPPFVMREARVAGSMSIGGAAVTYDALLMNRGVNSVVHRLSDVGYVIGSKVGETTTYPIACEWGAAANSLYIGAGYTRISSPRLTGLPAYADNAAALAGGLVAGDVYRIAGGGQLAIVFGS